MLPEGLRPLPGPAMVWAGHWAQTPVGPFSELAVAVPARLGLRPGLCVVLAVVTHPDARVAGRLAWGFPRQLGAVRWLAVDKARTCTWEERDVQVTATIQRGTIPFVALLRSLQRRSDGPVIVPARLAGWVRRATVSIDVPTDDDDLAPLAGRGRGWVLSGRQLLLDPARHPAGAWGSFVAPLRSPTPEPA